MRRLKYILTGVLVAALAVTIAPVAKTDAPEGCGTKFSVVPSDNIGTGDNRLKGVAANGELVVAVGFYTKSNGRKNGLIEVWDGVRMRAIPKDLGGYENEFVWIAANPAGGFRLVGTAWIKTAKGLTSKIVVGRFDGQRFTREATVSVPGSVRNIPHRILVSGSTAWVTGYFTRKFGEPPTAAKPRYVQMDRPYPFLPPYTEGDAKTYPLLVKVEEATWKRVRFPSEGWLDGLASRQADHLVVVGMSKDVAVAYELQEKTWHSSELPQALTEIKKIFKGITFKTLLDVVATAKGIVASMSGVFFFRDPSARSSSDGNGGLVEITNDGGIKYLGSSGPVSDPQVKVIIPSLPGHQGVRFYGIGRPYFVGGEGRIGRAIFYPGYREEEYPFKFEGEGITTTQAEIWAVGALYEPKGKISRTAVLRVCPPLQTATASPTGS